MPLTHEDCKVIRAKHFRGEVITVPALIRCFYDGEPWPCDTVRLLDLADEVVNFTTVWRETLPYAPDDYGFTMQCVEAVAAADLYRALDDERTAKAILDAHARHDTEEDDHYERGEELRQAQARKAAEG